MLRRSGRLTQHARSPDRNLSAALAGFRPVYQPIIDLQTGEVFGFEALARFAFNGALLGPDAVLPHLSGEERLALFTRTVEHAAALTRIADWPSTAAVVTINVEASVVLSDGFCDLLRYTLDGCAGDPSRIVVELLEGEQVGDHQLMAEVLTCLRRMGVRVALDDIGSGYASLVNLQRLPTDFVKLDSSFVANLRQRPGDLAFILMLSGLARSLDKRLVIEGVETSDVHDALAILGVDLAQGFAIAKPMAAEAIPAWLAGHERHGARRTPRSLLGAYASHLAVVETCRMLQRQPLEIEWKAQARDWVGCRIGRYFSNVGLHGAPCGQAHRRFHEVLGCYDTDRDTWEQAADAFRGELTKAIAFTCEQV